MNGPAPAAGWLGRIDLDLSVVAGRTAIARRCHSGPLVVQRALYPEGPVCHVYLLHPPGGVVGGDRLEVTVRVGAGAQALVTAPAATKFYRSGGAYAAQRQNLVVGAGASLEWLPQETILFDGALAETKTRVNPADDARFIGWEISALGRPASGEAFLHGHWRQGLELWRGRQPLWVERNDLEGGGAVLEAAWGLVGRAVTGTLVATPAGVSELDAARARIDAAGGGLFGATLLDEVLICRGLHEQAIALRERFSQLWQAIRPGVLGRAACPPRIWRT